MKLISRIVLPAVLLLSSCLHAEQTLLLAKAADVTKDVASTTAFARPVVRESGDMLLEHALNDYHHYYSRACDVKLFDFILSPVYKHERVIDGSGMYNMYGGFMQAQLSLGDFYLRANTQFGYYNEEFKDKDGKEVEFTNADVKDALKDTSFDDVNLKAGYDFFFCGDDHIGFYALGGIPVNRKDASVAATLSNDTITFKAMPWMYEVRMGTGNYRIGGGLNAAFTLVDCDDHHLAWLSDTQYTYALKTDVAKITGCGAELKYTPGNTLNFFNALHYACGCYNFELGSVFATTFGEKWSIDCAECKYPEKYGETNFAPALAKLNAKNMTVAFKAQPYLAFSYNTCVCDCPLTVGLGAGYDYNKLHDNCTEVSYPEYEHYPEHCATHKPDAFQGVTAWGTVALSF